MKTTELVRPNLTTLLDETAATQEQAIGAIRRALAGTLGKRFDDAIALITDAAAEAPRPARRRVIVSGLGKSGHIGRKIAATLASTGTPAHFVHAAEASHGDLGMVTPQDVILLLSNSGETAELRDILTYAKRFAIPLIAITGNAKSTLARVASVALVYPKVREACPLQLAPTTSTMQQLVLGDMLAIGLMSDAEFSATDFGLYHPGGKLGAQLARVDSIMHKANALPLVEHDAPMGEALIEMSSKAFGCVGVMKNGALIGIVTDGDLRRHMSAGLITATTAGVMTPNPATIEGGMLAVEALAEMNAKAITSLFVTKDQRPVGIVHVHDLLRYGVR
ncbi:KpsF/GutQ family sugar-phosphate isomerase [Acuticoccus sp. MNP-M23]|uniref:KpsF/GutQ family sugar-phosphate isomerase n=1 Tax=Acuticoccus sp. MNP-M23 TaxID=3072793 RepID=UPI0028160DE3|nr:KpsF/GutQ family sugar-phosphate isomerase [Acuticoccus sp. MNP-M23]WMS43295.1 KpsF/GutQ family sugar-phosphate isomerase [Acuticoccus sp. MNP-M23]